MSGELKKLSIIKCSYTQNSPIKAVGPKLNVMFNPTSLGHVSGINYVNDCNDNATLGSTNKESKFFNYTPDDLSFDLVIDGTSVSVKGKSESVSTRLKALRIILYNYEGKKHEPNVVQLLWGDFIFHGRLTSLNTEHTLFNSNGESLRAKVKLSFTGFQTSTEAELKKNKSSPDLTHIVVVNSGDTLPLLCQKIYNDQQYYIEVARFNGLASFINLTPGNKLYFPPLV